MSRTVDTKQYLDLALSLLQEGKTNVPVTVSGVSMTPFLHPGDTVFLNLPDRPYRVGDVVLFTRPNGTYVLHRIVQADASVYLMLGDSQTIREPICADCVHALVTSIRIENRHINEGHPYFLFYKTIWRWLEPLRPLIGKIHNLIHKKSR